MTSSGESWLGEKGDLINLRNAKVSLWILDPSLFVRSTKPTYGYGRGKVDAGHIPALFHLVPSSPDFVRLT